MERYLKDVNLPVYICLDELDEAEDIERLMLDGLNNSTIEELVEQVRLSKRQAENVIKHLPITRLHHLLKKDKIGKTTYERLFNYFSIKANAENEQQLPVHIQPEDKYEQLSLF